MGLCLPGLILEYPTWHPLVYHIQLVNICSWILTYCFVSWPQKPCVSHGRKTLIDSWGVLCPIQTFKKWNRIWWQPDSALHLALIEHDQRYFPGTLTAQICFNRCPIKSFHPNISISWPSFYPSPASCLRFLRVRKTIALIAVHEKACKMDLPNLVLH